MDNASSADFIVNMLIVQHMILYEMIPPRYDTKSFLRMSKRHKHIIVMMFVCLFHTFVYVTKIYSHIRSLGAAGALAVDICICFHDTES